MPFTVPSFPITCDLYDGGVIPLVLREASVPCNLGMGRRVYMTYGSLFGGDEVSGVNPVLLLPAFTDIRDMGCGVPQDVVEVPSGSGRYYEVTGVDDVGKGFANEFRVAALVKAYDKPGVLPWSGSGIYWPIPIP